jgi:DNA-directed RNA polymerase specialized sigma24 family protein
MALATDRPAGLSAQALDRLFERLGPDREAAGREYEAIRRRLLDFFGRRGVPTPAELADEALDRLARRLHEGEVVEHLRPYCYGIARRVLLEWRKEKATEAAALTKAPRWEPPGRADVEAQAARLERCLEELPAESRDLIVAYYHGAGNAHLEGRQLLAGRLGITYATLKTRAHRIRILLRACLERGLADRGNP